MGMLRGVFTFDNARDNVKSIFLAGPTPMPEFLRLKKSWRHDAVQLLEKYFFDGDVFIPEPSNGENPEDWTYSKQVDWEVKMLAKATVILFWIPRDLMALPGFTTNIEFGEWMKSGKIIVGAPDGAPKVRYIQERCNRLKIPVFNTLEACVDNAIQKASDAGACNKTWFTADTHFGQKRTLELSRRPFTSVDEMSWEMVRRWNTIVGENDVVYHLGDFGDPAFLKYLRCKTLYFLPGNYDGDVLSELATDKRVEVISANHVAMIGGNRVKLVHAPEDAIAQDHSPVGDFFLFGHIHQLQMIKKNGLNVGVDCHGFAPIDVETVGFYKNAIRQHYDNNVFIDLLGAAYDADHL
jgi:calcineurin-like phosphoesterase family protein